MAAKVCPLRKVIDAGRWDAEGFLGRLIVVVHAAFIDAGFLSLPRPSRKRGPIPREAGRTAAALSLIYTAPELLHRQDIKAAAVLRMQVYGRKIILYVQCAGRRVASSWMLVDAFDAAALLLGGLDGTARALRRDASLVALWRRLFDILCRHALVDLCRLNGVSLEPTFMSLPSDIKTAILARLNDGVDLARVECTCTALRRLVAERHRELWKPLYDNALGTSLWFLDATDSPETSWKKRYLRARRWQLPTYPFLWPRRIQTLRIMSRLWWYDNSFQQFDRDDPQELPADPVAKRSKRKRTTAGRSKRAAEREQGKRRHGAGAIHAPSSRYRWKHR